MTKRLAFSMACVLALASGNAVAQNLPDCRPDALHLRTGESVVRFGVDLAETPESRSQGLMFVESMPASRGMLFVYERPQSVAFWMRNTLIPLDMIFMDATGVVQKVHENAQPHDETGIPGGNDIQYVLEINGGLADQLGIVPGTEMRHPSLGAEAEWSCDAS